MDIIILTDRLDVLCGMNNSVLLALRVDGTSGYFAYEKCQRPIIIYGNHNIYRSAEGTLCVR